LKAVLSEGWWSLAGNLSQTVAASVTVLIGMFILGLFIALGTWTVSWSNHVKRELVVHVYFQPDATKAEETALASALQSNPYVRPGSIRFVSKQAGFEIMKRQQPGLAASLPYNPLGDAISVAPDKAENVQRLYSSIVGQRIPRYISTVRDGRQISSRILQVAHTIEAIFTVATIILLGASVLLISNTIRLSIFSRRREIEVMKLVGATNWFVRGPFIVEGLLCGFAGSFLAVCCLALGRALALPALLPNLSGDQDVHALSFPLTAVILIGIGLAIGAAGSGLTMRRFLRV
jgi:cell division transport system permease protein